MMSADARRITLFLFAHQDDEFGVFQQILEEQAAGRRAICAYLTDGAVGSVTSAQRNRESLGVLADLGVERGDVVFAGEKLGIADGALPQNLLAAVAWLDAWLETMPRPEAVFVPAWEGGHHDHDALHALAVTSLSKAGLLGVTRQFALYTAWHCRSPFFRVLKPIPENGPVRSTPISWRNRLRFLRYCLLYPSQMKTWIGLYPFVMLRYLSGAGQQTQPVSLARIACRPYQGAMFYEARGVYTWDALSHQLKELGP